MKKFLAALLALTMTMSLAGCSLFFGTRGLGVIGGADGPTEIIITTGESESIGGEEAPADIENNHAEELPDNAPPEGLDEEIGEGDYLIDEDGWYYSAEDVSLYLATYGYLPGNFITKSEARELGWEGGSVEKYAPGCAIGGDKFQNREGTLPKADGRTYYECDIDTDGASSRGAKRIVFSSDGNIYYTEDHYETFELLYEEAWG